MRIIIIGGGPAALASALRLRTVLDAEVIVYEIRPEPTTLGGAVQLPPNGLRLIDRLGLTQQLNARGFRSSRRQTHSMQGELIADVDRDQQGRDSSGFGFMRIMRKDLVDVLLEGARAQGIIVRFGMQLTRIDEGEQSVSVTFSNGHTDSGNMLLGCDGIHSAVRRLQVDRNAEPLYSGTANLLGVLSTSNLDPASREIAPALHTTKTPNGLLGLSPCNAAADQLYWFFSRAINIPSSNSKEGWEAKSKQDIDAVKDELLEALREAQGPWGEQLRDIVRKTQTVKFYPIFKMPPHCKWSSKRCLLLGDAAHAMQPHVGQGTAMALEDVFWLSRLLDDPNRSLADTFEHFERVRRPRVDAMSRAAADRGKLRTAAMALPGKHVKEAENDFEQGAVSYDIMQEPLTEITRRL